MSESVWIVPVANDIAQVLSIGAVGKANENIDADTIAAKLADENFRATYDPNLPDRAQKQIELAVAQCRAAIQLGAKIPLSLTAGSVPPEAVKHVLYMAAYGLVNSIPSLLMAVMNEHGVYSPLMDNFKLAQKYIDGLSAGKQCVPPSDPTGRDYITAINMPWFCSTPSPFPEYNSDLPINPPVQPVRFGGMSRPADLTTFDSIFMTNVPANWPNNLGMP